jgi:acyl-CoA synthetase (AMP-forming)/AMP-acid ligase II
MPVTDEFLAWSAREPQRPALVTGNTVLSYAGLAHRAQAIAAALSSGIAPSGGRVALALANDARFVECVLGVMLAGMTAVVADPKWTGSERRAALTGAATDLIITADAGSLDPPVATARVLSLTGLYGHAASAGSMPRTAVADDGPLLVTFTSGTTGTPKGVLRQHRSWMGSIAAARAAFPLVAGERVLITTPLAHSIGLFALIETLASGASAWLPPGFAAGALVPLIEEQGITRLVGVPTIYARLLAAAAAPLPQVRTVVSAGAKLPPADRARLQRLFPRACVIEYYGASELSFVTVARPDEGCPAQSVGRPMAGVTVEIRDETGNVCSPGEIGRIWVRSAMLAQSYVCGDGVPGPIIGDDGFASVGDRGWCDAAGWLHLSGRDGGMLISGGLNVYPAEVESVLCSHPGVADAVVLGLPDAEWGDLVVAIVEGRPPRSRVGADELVAHCRARLAGYKCPKRILFTDAWPRTASGKIARSRLRAMLVADRGRERVA